MPEIINFPNQPVSNKPITGKELMEFAAGQLDIAERMMIAQHKTIAAMLKIHGPTTIPYDLIEVVDPKLIDIQTIDAEGRQLVQLTYKEPEWHAPETDTCTPAD